MAIKKNENKKIVASTSATPSPERIRDSSGVFRARDIELDKVLLTVGDESNPEQNIQIALLKKPFRGKQIVCMRFGEDLKHGRNYYTLQTAIIAANEIYKHWLQGQKDIKK